MSALAAATAGVGSISSDSPLLRAAHVSKRFPGVTALDDVSLSVWPGEVHGLVGANGAGKSTLLKIISGVYSPDTGNLVWDGATVDFRTAADAVRRGIEMVPQELDLALNLSAAENIAMGVYPSRLGQVRWKEIYRRAQEVATAVRLEADLRRKCATLSLAEQRLVMVARALARSARLVIMDEPTVSLTELEVDALKTVVRELRAKGVAVIYVSHRLDEVMELSDRVTVMKDGKLVATHNTKEVTKRALIEEIIAGTYREPFVRRPARASGTTVLRVRNLSGGFVRDVSFDVGAGEIVGLAGLVGSGRSEVLRMLYGADPHESGSIEVSGRAVKMRHPGEAIRHGLALIPEDRRRQGAIMSMSIAANVSLPVIQRFALRGLGVIRDRVEERAVEAAISRFHVDTPSVRRPLKFLSGGNQQKTVVAKWGMTDARVFMFDEPTAGVDVGARQEIYALLRQLAAEGAGVIVVSSELEEVVGLAQRVVVMREGRCAGVLEGDEITESGILRLCYAE